MRISKMLGRWAIFGLLLIAAAVSPAQARTIHMVAFGNSATSGWLVAPEEAYPAQLQKLLRKKGYDVTVANEGVPGDTTASALRRLDAAIGPDTDIVLVELGTNDVRVHVPPREMRVNLNAIIATLRNRHIFVLVIGLGGLDLAAIAKANGVAYVQWKLPPGKFRARDKAHFNAAGYALLIERSLPQIELLIKRAAGT
jgi:acyl-CoA thioesterase-1